MDISNRIKQIREQKRIKQVEVSDALDMNNSFYAKLEKRGNKLTIEQVEKIAGALGVSVADLLGLDISPKIEQTTTTTAKKDKEIEELRKRVAELEDRVKDKEKLNLNLEKDLENTNRKLVESLYSYIHSLVDELKVTLFTNPKGHDFELISLPYFVKERLYTFLSYNVEDIRKVQSLNFLKSTYPDSLPYIKFEDLKKVITYAFGKDFFFASKMYILCLTHVKDERFVRAWNKVFQELLNQEREKENLNHQEESAE